MNVALTECPTGNERFFGSDEIIVSKTDTKGIITYANGVFLRVAGYDEEELLGRPHNLIRHPDMPRCVFKLLWDRLQRREEVFAYVVNLAKNGDHYWVFAHVTPSVDRDGQVVGYHSSRRSPERSAVAKAAALYQALLAEESLHSDRRQGMLAGEQVLLDELAKIGMPYEEFVFTL